MTSFFDTEKLARVRAAYANRSDPESARAFADLYWRGLLSIAVIVVFVAAVGGAMLFFSVLGATVPPAAASSAPAPAAPAIDTASLDATLQAYATRQADFQALENRPAPATPDPSQ